MKKLLVMLAIFSGLAFGEIKIVPTDGLYGLMVSVKSSDPEVKVYKITVQSGRVFEVKTVFRDSADSPDSVKYTTVTFENIKNSDVITVQCFKLQEAQYRLMSNTLDLTYPGDK